MNALYYGDNLNILRRYIADESVDLIYLDPPFNSSADYNVLFAEKDSHLPGVAPLGSLAGDPVALDWCGHVWSAWEPLSLLVQRGPSNANGLYRIRRADESSLLYPGQGRVSMRLSAHQRKVSLPNNRQAAVFDWPIGMFRNPR